MSQCPQCGSTEVHNSLVMPPDRHNLTRPYMTGEENGYEVSACLSCGHSEAMTSYPGRSTRGVW